MESSWKNCAQTQLCTIVTPSSIATRRACERYYLNTHKSLLYALPYELVQRIGRFLSYQDRICFALSSHKYYDALCITRIPSGTKLVETEVNRRRERDHFYSRDHCFFSWVRRGFGQIFCVGCATPHMPFRFPDNTIAQPLHLRKCFRATDRPLYVCPHHQLTFLELASMLRKQRRMGRREKHGAFFKCMECADYPYSRYRPGLCMHAPTLYLEPKTSTVTLRMELLLLFKPTFQYVSVQQVRDALALINLKICPHMKASDTTTMDRMVGFRRGEDRLKRSPSKRPNTRPSIECEVCQTTFRIKSDLTKDSKIMVEVGRRFGKLKWEGDPIWRAHLSKRVDGNP